MKKCMTLLILGAAVAFFAACDDGAPTTFDITLVNGSSINDVTITEASFGSTVLVPTTPVPQYPLAAGGNPFPVPDMEPGTFNVTWTEENGSNNPCSRSRILVAGNSYVLTFTPDSGDCSFTLVPDAAAPPLK